jgi:signal transduction histidine kinase
MRYEIVISVALLGNVLLLILLVRSYYCNRKKLFDIRDSVQCILDGKPLEEDIFWDDTISEIYYLLYKLSGKNIYYIRNLEDEKNSIKRNISNMSHQLKTPLADVILYEDILKDGKLNIDEKKIVNERLRTQTHKIQWIMESIIKCTQLEEEAIRFDTSPQLLIDTLIDALNCVAGKAEQKNIEFVLETFDENLKVMHNRKWTAEVFENLFENAIKYSPENSQIDIVIEQMDVYTKILIRDHGIGIKINELEKIFKRFYRSKDVENMTGSGLGLYLSRLILEKEEGSIYVRSEYGKGSEFCVMLKNYEDEYGKDDSKMIVGAN